jgi:TetR/AcrR family transcriptional regulator, regulator of cefoperazone and chloramphenicol sensitivity
MAATSESTDTRQRLLESAGEVFAASGFEHATVREICERAGANIAAVNYHFGDKQGLYRAVFDYAASSKPLPPAAGGDPETRLRAAVRALMTCIFDRGQPAWYGRLMIRELAEPTDVLVSMVENVCRPLYEALQGVVSDLVGGKLSKPALGRAARSLLGQCVYYHHARAVLARLEPKLHFDAEEVDQHVEHIVTFTLGGLARLVGETGRT